MHLLALGALEPGVLIIRGMRRTHVLIHLMALGAF